MSHLLYTIHPLTRLLISLSKHKMVNNSPFIYFPIKSHSSFWPSFNSIFLGSSSPYQNLQCLPPLELKPIHLFYLFIYRFPILSPPLQKLLKYKQSWKVPLRWVWPFLFSPLSSLVCLVQIAFSLIMQKIKCLILMLLKTLIACCWTKESVAVI